MLVRIVTGFGEAGFFVGAATMITDLAPVERRGEAVSYWSVAVYGGLSLGPVLGSVLHGDGHYGRRVDRVGRVSRCSPRSSGSSRWRSRATCRPSAPKHLLHRAAIPPGSVLFLGLIPLAGFTAFVPLYADGPRRRARA